MLKLLAIFSPRLRAILELPGEVKEALEAVRAVLVKYDSDPGVHAALNEIADVRKKLNEIIGPK